MDLENFLYDFEPKPGPAVALVSGGLDSVTLAHLLHAQGCSPLHLVSIDYGQRHRVELEYAAACARRLGAQHSIIDLTSITRHLAGCALTDDRVAVPHGRYEEALLRATVVPNRNAMMLTIAFGIAASSGARIVSTAIHSGDHAVYPDCRPGFVHAFAQMQRSALLNIADVELYTPFVRRTKAEIVLAGARVNVPFEATWSCYEGGADHCGYCSTCRERQEAFHIAEISDPTVYASFTRALSNP